LIDVAVTNPLGLTVNAIAPEAKPMNAMIATVATVKRSAAERIIRSPPPRNRQYPVFKLD